MNSLDEGKARFLVPSTRPTRFCAFRLDASMYFMLMEIENKIKSVVICCKAISVAYRQGVILRLARQPFRGREWIARQGTYGCRGQELRGGPGLCGLLVTRLRALGRDAPVVGRRQQVCTLAWASACRHFSDIRDISWLNLSTLPASLWWSG